MAALLFDLKRWNVIQVWIWITVSFTIVCIVYRVLFSLELVSSCVSGRGIDTLFRVLICSLLCSFFRRISLYLIGTQGLNCLSRALVIAETLFDVLAFTGCRWTKCGCREGWNSVWLACYVSGMLVIGWAIWTRNWLAVAFVEDDGTGMGLWSIVAGVKGLEVVVHLAFGGEGRWHGAVWWLGQLWGDGGIGVLRPQDMARCQWL